MEPTSVPKQKRQEDNLNSCDRFPGSDGNSNNISGDNFQQENLNLDSGSRLFIISGKDNNECCYDNKGPKVYILLTLVLRIFSSLDTPLLIWTWVNYFSYYLVFFATAIYK